MLPTTLHYTTLHCTTLRYSTHTPNYTTYYTTYHQSEVPVLLSELTDEVAGSVTPTHFALPCGKVGIKAPCSMNARVRVCVCVCVCVFVNVCV
jgi:hypothetical protein